MLQKWKKEKELMKKMDLAQQAKKKPFRVLHVDTEVFPFQKFTQPSKVFIANTLRISSFINITDKFVNLISKGWVRLVMLNNSTYISSTCSLAHVQWTNGRIL